MPAVKTERSAPLKSAGQTMYGLIHDQFSIKFGSAVHNNNLLSEVNFRQICEFSYRCIQRIFYISFSNCAPRTTGGPADDP
jgi:ABC-type polysaccharide/polyol phosphate export permease